MAVQVKLLQLLSKESHQNITYHCRNSVAYKDKKSSNLKKALVLRGFNGQELRAQGNNRLRYNVIEDGCSVSLPTECLDSMKDNWETLKVIHLAFFFL